MIGFDAAARRNYLKNVSAYCKDITNERFFSHEMRRHIDSIFTVVMLLFFYRKCWYSDVA